VRVHGSCGGRSYGAGRRLVQLVALFLLLASAPSFAADRLVLAFGDSLTAGYGLKQSESYPAKLEAALRRSGIPATVHNGGVSGETTAGGRARLAWQLQGLKAKPDLIILELGANDMLRGMDPGAARANLDAMLVELKRRRIPVLLTGMLAAPNLGAAYRRQFDAVYPALARKHGVAFYPFFMRGVAGDPRLLQPDGLHPTAKGVPVIVRGLLPQVKTALAARR
jgi:acyl-CoA thioesterase-1